eukprot:CAMPEP_0113316180 /NCGR_PEP_ID=MMETSP0010_2-20120614/11547_1 /TAXON_ID=216773 ORGANISM="Corethron hystrix, Strain 308" /NCGR_SAMPLE_ID=MMETSP0010_2 /ASSEMBLY_ACC=CAM_ASM_000155 /LENGTH=51 /DNA_ID=CAMNT_0000172821 /DNA_START=494 /DNA_END=649 /DNA_ORIENTATION=- /assembly_acc=CAM_ASM_000155
MLESATKGSRDAKPYASHETLAIAMIPRGIGFRSPREEALTAFKTAKAGEK